MRTLVRLRAEVRNGARERSFCVRPRRNVEGTSERIRFQVPYARRGASSEAVVAPSFRPRPAVVFVPNFQDQGGAAWVVGPLQAPRGFLGHLQTSFVTCGSLSNVSRPGHLKKDARHEQKKVGGRIVRSCGAGWFTLARCVRHQENCHYRHANGANRHGNVSGPKFLAKEQDKRFGHHQKGGGVWDCDRKTHIESIGSMGR